MNLPLGKVPNQVSFAIPAFWQKLNEAASRLPMLIDLTLRARNLRDIYTGKHI